MNWIHQAACRGHDPELWFSTRPSKTKTALAVCRTCPVIGECREWADGHSRINGYPLQGHMGRPAIRRHEQTKKGQEMNKKIDIDVTAYQIGPVVLMCGAAAPGHDVTHQECFGRFTVLALSLNAAIRKCMRRVARMCADCSAREQLDHQEGARA